jgi:hypothetical protein
MAAGVMALRTGGQLSSILLLRFAFNRGFPVLIPLGSCLARSFHLHCLGWKICIASTGASSCIDFSSIGNTDTGITVPFWGLIMIDDKMFLLGGLNLFVLLAVIGRSS